jgi:hypothetical protein
MRSVFVVFHEYETSSGCDSSKFIGVYASREAGEAAILRTRMQPGFCDFPDGFSIDEYELNKDHWQEGFGGTDPV